MVLSISPPFVVLSFFNTSRYPLGRVTLLGIIPICCLTNSSGASATQFTDERWSGLMFSQLLSFTSELTSLYFAPAPSLATDVPPSWKPHPSGCQDSCLFKPSTRPSSPTSTQCTAQITISSGQSTIF